MADLAALLFDLDGTLVDTAEANYRAYAGALAEIDCAIDRATFDRVATGRRWSQFLPVLAPDADHAALAARKQVLYPQVVAAARINTPLVELARGSGLRCALVTNASRAGANTVLSLHGLTDLFEVVVTGDDIALPKPAPEAYLLAMAKLGVTPGQCLVFEDSDIGVDSARAAGVQVLRTTW